MDMLTLIAAGVRRGAHKEAERFAAKVKPGHTYYEIVDCYFAWGQGRLLQEWTFSKPGKWIGQEPRCGHLTAKGAWLTHGPLHERRPADLQTFDEFRRRPSFPPDVDMNASVREMDAMLRSAKLVSAGV